MLRRQYLRRALVGEVQKVRFDDVEVREDDVERRQEDLPDRMCLEP
jgi:hypothetical protein